MYEVYQVHPKQTRLNIRVVLAVVFLVCAIGAGIFLITRLVSKPLAKEDARGQTGIVYDSSAVEGGWDNLSPEEIAERLNQKVAEGMINISMNTAPYFENGASEGNIMIVNESINNYPQQVEFIRNDTGEQIYQSNAIPVGSKIERAALDVELPAGTYECTAMFHNLDPVSGEVIGTAGAIINITIKNYIRKRIGSRLSSTYVDIYSDELYQLLLRNARDAREFKKNIRHLDKELAALGYSDVQLSSRVQMNLDFARVNMKSNIYDQAILEGVATSFPQTEDIIENGTVNGMTATDVQKILNLKHAWEFILDRDVISYPTDYSILCHIAKLVNEGFFQDGGRVRGVPVTIGGTSYIPPMPIESVIKENMDEILKADLPSDEIAIRLCLYCMRTQIFNDG